MSRFIIAGGPHTGKSTLLKDLQGEFGDRVYFAPEPAEYLILEEKRKAEADSAYEAIFPWDRHNYPRFAEMALQRSVELYQKAPGDKPAVFDRSAIDDVAYVRLNEYPEEHPLMQRVRSTIGKLDYSTVFMCEPVGNYTATAVRAEDADFARTVHQHVVGAYSEYGHLNHIPLPAVSRQERLDIVAPHIYAALGGKAVA